MEVGGTISVILSYPSSACLRILKLEAYMNMRQDTALNLRDPYCFCWIDFITSTDSLLQVRVSILLTGAVGSFHATRGLKLAFIGLNIDSRT